MVPFTVISSCCRNYKRLALLVHPDKCSHTRIYYRSIYHFFSTFCPGAEDAFKKLSLAYECLVDQVRQHEYINSTKRGPKNKRRRSTQAPMSSKSSLYVADNNRNTAKRWRTPQEIFEAFMVEEERQAEAEFHKRGFERVFVRSPPPAEVALESKDNRYNDVKIVEQEQVLSSGLEYKRSGWQQFAKRDVATVSEPTTFYCLLCRRKFLSREKLKRHEAESDLHQQNLRKSHEQTANLSHN
jgi:curved DNA-binding protein CbpA